MLRRHLFVSDFQIPDHNKEALKSLLRFISDFKPDQFYIVGDFLNFTKASDYEVVGDVCPTLGEEIKAGRAVLYDLVTATRNANKKADIFWFSGNHEYRLGKFLAKGGNVLADIYTENGEPLVSIEHIFNLRQLGIKWFDYYESYETDGIVIEHGNIARSKAGYTGQAQLDKYGRSGLSGHTHKMAFVTRKLYDDVRFWIEIGSMCNPEPSPKWMKKPDWVNGFAVGIYNAKSKILHPTPILMQNNEFCFDGKIYTPKKP